MYVHRYQVFELDPNHKKTSKAQEEQTNADQQDKGSTRPSLRSYIATVSRARSCSLSVVKAFHLSQWHQRPGVRSRAKPDGASTGRQNVRVRDRCQVTTNDSLFCNSVGTPYKKALASEMCLANPCFFSNE